MEIEAHVKDFVDMFVAQDSISSLPTNQIINGDGSMKAKRSATSRKGKAEMITFDEYTQQLIAAKLKSIKKEPMEHKKGKSKTKSSIDSNKISRPNGKQTKSINSTLLANEQLSSCTSTTKKYESVFETKDSNTELVLNNSTIGNPFAFPIFGNQLCAKKNQFDIKDFINQKLFFNN